MNGCVKRIVPLTPYDFSLIQGSQSQTIVLARKIDVRGYREATFMVRTHAGTNVGSVTALDLLALADGFTDEDPAAQSGAFPAFMPQIGIALMTFKTSPIGSMALGRVDTTGVTPPGGFGGMLALGLSVTQSSTPASALVWLSVDLCLKD